MNCGNLHFALIPEDDVEAEVISERQSVRAAKRRERRDLALKAMESKPDGITIAELAAAMKIAYSVAWPLVRELQADGQIEECETIPTGARRQPAYRITPSA
jgi:predicted transcriptional regulator